MLFELAAPPEFRAWRDSTSFLLQEVLGLELAEKDKYSYSYRLHRLQLDVTLKEYALPDIEEQRVHLGSYGGTSNKIYVKGDTSNDEVCPVNTLKFQYQYDGAPVALQPVLTDSLSKSCTYKLPPASSTLQQFLIRRFSGDECTPNTVIASQSTRPSHMSLGEYRSLVAILVGYRLQWINILTQLASPTIDLRKIEVSTIIHQAIYQTGPLEDEHSLGGSFHRAIHSVLAEDAFAQRVLSCVGSAAARIEANWESAYALGALISIVTRQLALTTSQGIQEQALTMLSRLRQTAHGWTNVLKKKLELINDDGQRDEFAEKLELVALICCGTFDVPSKMQLKILSQGR